MTDGFLCIMAGCVLGADVCHWMFKKRKSTWFKFQGQGHGSRFKVMVQGQEDSPLSELLTLEHWYSFPHGDGSERGELSKCHLHEEQRQSSKHQHDDVGDEERCCARKQHNV